MPKKLTNEQFLERARKVHGDKYVYLEEYVNASTKLKIECKIHGIFKQEAWSHLNSYGCKVCAHITGSRKRLKSNEQFVIEANILHNNKYKYIGNYINAFTEIEIKCPIHGIFFQTPTSHLNTYGCTDCGNSIGGLKNRKTYEQFVIEATKIHCNKYNYSESDINLVKNKILIICNICNYKFDQTPDNHLSGKGCPKCADKVKAKLKRKPISILIDQLKSIHGDKYNYSYIDQENYKNKGSSILIKCCLCDAFFNRNVSNLLLGCGCSCQVKFGPVSKSEKKWLDSLNIPLKNRNVRIKLGKSHVIPDGLDPLTNTTYEFYGDYWHGNPNKFDPNKINRDVKITFGELYEATLKREKLLIDAGYKIVSIWESDWLALCKKAKVKIK